MKIGHITVLVKDYDRAIEFYTKCLGFQLITDNDFGDGYRWVSVAPQDHNETAIVFVKADTEEKLNRVGNQVSDHVFLTLQTDDCIKDYETMKSKGVLFHGEPKIAPWGIEVVFEDLYGNIFDLVQLRTQSPKF